MAQSKINKRDILIEGTSVVLGTDGSGNVVEIPQGSLGGGGGSSNPNEFIPVGESDLANALNANKIACIQANITLTGNLTLANKLKLKNCGGHLILNGFTLTGDQSSFDSTTEDIVIDATTGIIAGTWNTPKYFYATNIGLEADGVDTITGSITSGTNVVTLDSPIDTSRTNQLIAIRGAATGFIDNDDPTGIKSLSTTVTSFNSSTELVIGANATRTATNELIWIGKDNFDAGKNAIYLRNQRPGTIDFNGDLFFLRAVDVNESAATDLEITGFRNEWSVGEGTDNITVTGTGTLAMFAHNKRKSRVLSVFNTHNSKIQVNIRGDHQMHNYSGLPLADTGDDFNIGLFIGSAVYNLELEGIDIYSIDGTLVTSTGDQQFINYIKGDGTGDTTLTIGSIDDLTGALTPDVNSSTAYTTDLLDVSTVQFERTRNARPGRKGRRHYSFSGSSFSGWAGFKTRDYRVAYYDASQTFLRISDTQRMYDIIEYDDDVTFVRLIVDTPLDITAVDGQVRAPLNPVGCYINNCKIYDATAHGFSNMPSHTNMHGGEISYIGNVLPAFAVNFEDQRDATQHVVFDGVKFKDCYTGYFNAVGTIGVNIQNCEFGATSDPFRVRTDFTTAISVNDCYDSQVTNNRIYNGAVQLDRNAQFYNNLWVSGRLETTANGVDIYNNEMFQVVISNLVKTEDRTVSSFRNNRLYYYKNWETSLVTDTNMRMIWEDNIIIFNDFSRLTNLIDENSTFEEVVLGENGTNLFDQSPAPTQDFGGYFKNFKMQGARQDISTRDFAKGSNYFPAINWYGYDNYVECNMVVKYGLPKDLEINNLTLKGWLEIDLDQYADAASGSAPTHTYNNLKVIIENGVYNWTNNGSYVLDTNDKDVNLVFNDSLFDLQVVSDSVGTYYKWMRLQHFGTTNFNRTTFRSVSAKTIDLNNYPAGLGDIIFTDCTFDNVTFILRAGDSIVTTAGGGNSDLGYTASPTNGIITNTNGDDATLSLANGTNAGLLSPTDFTKLSNTSGTNTGDQNASQVSVAATPSNYTAGSATVEAHLVGIDSALGAASGFDSTTDKLLSDGSNLSPTFDQENSSDTRLRSYVLNTISYIESEKISDDTALGLRIKASSINPTVTALTDLGQNTLRYRDGFFSRNVTAAEFRVEGGTGLNVLLDDGSTVLNNFTTLSDVYVQNNTKVFQLVDANNIIYTSSGNHSYTIPVSTTTNFDIGTKLTLLNTSGVNNPTLIPDSGVTFVSSWGSDYTLYGAGEKFVATKINTDTWVVDIITNPANYTGWADYTDTIYTSGSPFTVTASTVASLPNNAGTSNETQLPVDVPTFYNGTTITGRNGDGIAVTIEFKCRPAGVAANPRLNIRVDIGGAVGEIFQGDFLLNKGSGVEHYFLRTFTGYTLGTWEANGGIIEVEAFNEDIEIYDIRYVITRTHRAR